MKMPTQIYATKIYFHKQQQRWFFSSTKNELVNCINLSNLLLTFSVFAGLFFVNGICKNTGKNYLSTKFSYVRNNELKWKQ